MAPLNATGSLRFSQIEQEFGQSIVRSLGEYRISKTIGDMSNIPLDEGIGQEKDDRKDIRNGDATNSIRFSQFRGKRLNVVVHYAVNETRAIGGHNKYTNDDSSVTVIGPEGGVREKPTNGTGAKVILHVSARLLSNKVPGDQSGSHRERCALRTGNPEYWDPSVILHINVGNEALISGIGGNGGAGGDGSTPGNDNGGNGENGSSAIGIATPVEKIIVQSGGVVQAGGGGGGGGGGAGNDLASVNGGNGGAGAGPGAAGNGGNGSAADTGEEGGVASGGGGGGGSPYQNGGGSGGERGIKPQQGRSTDGSPGSRSGGGSGGSGDAEGGTQIEGVGGGGGNNGYAIITKGQPIPFTIIGVPSIAGDIVEGSSNIQI